MEQTASMAAPRRIIICQSDKMICKRFLIQTLTSWGKSTIVTEQRHFWTFSYTHGDTIQWDVVAISHRQSIRRNLPVSRSGVAGGDNGRGALKKRARYWIFDVSIDLSANEI
jgi:hypothetical protein